MSKIKASDFIEIDEKFIDDLAAKLKEHGVEPKEKQAYTTKEVADIVKKDIQTIRRHIESGLLIANKPGKNYIITKENLTKYIKGD